MLSAEVLLRQTGPDSVVSEAVEPGGPLIRPDRHRLIQQDVLTLTDGSASKQTSPLAIPPGTMSPLWRMSELPKNPLLMMVPDGCWSDQSNRLKLTVLDEPFVSVTLEHTVGPRVESPATSGVAVTVTSLIVAASPALTTVSSFRCPGKDTAGSASAGAAASVGSGVCA